MRLKLSIVFFVVEYYSTNYMKRINLLLLALAMVVMSGCSVIGGIFKAGFAVGIIVVIIIIALIIWIVSMFRK